MDLVSQRKYFLKRLFEEKVLFFGNYSRKSHFFMRFYFVFVLLTSVLQKTNNFFKNKKTPLATRFGGKNTRKNNLEFPVSSVISKFEKSWNIYYDLQN